MGRRSSPRSSRPFAIGALAGLVLRLEGEDLEQAVGRDEGDAVVVLRLSACHRLTRPMNSSSIAARKLLRDCHDRVGLAPLDQGLLDRRVDVAKLDHDQVLVHEERAPVVAPRP